jgi:hypothetical protein
MPPGSGVLAGCGIMPLRRKMQSMSEALQPIDVTGSPELLRLAEEVERSGVGRLLKRGEHEVAVITPAVSFSRLPKRPGPRRKRQIDRADPLFNIVGMCRVDEPTNVATSKDDYLAEAYYDEFGRPPEQ